MQVGRVVLSPFGDAAGCDEFAFGVEVDRYGKPRVGGTYVGQRLEQLPVAVGSLDEDLRLVFGAGAAFEGADGAFALLRFYGVGEKVADCIALFGFARGDAFPVDTWIEKVYREDFGGTYTDRNAISAYFKGLFGEFSGYVQQYLFYAKRSKL